MVEVACSCGTRLRLGDEWAGRRGRCPRCGAVLVIPGPRARAAPPVTPPAASGPQAPLPAPPSRRAAAAAPPPPSPEEVSASVAAPPVDPLVEEAPPDPLPPPLPAAPALKRTPPWRKWLATGAAAALVLLAAAAVYRGAVSWRSSESRDQRQEPKVASRERTTEGQNDKPQNLLRAESRQEESPEPKVASQKLSVENPEASVESQEPNAVGQEATVEARQAADLSPSPGTPGQSALEARPRPAPPPPGPGGLTGVSRQYDDLHCRRIQITFGLAVPAGATILEVDGDRLPISNVPQLQRGLAPYLLLPKGRHAVQFAPGERAVEVAIADHLGDVYEDMRRFFDVPDNVKIEELFSRGARALDVHQAPFLLNFMGAWYAAQDQWGAAERKFRRSLRVNPTFSPAHLNLAYCLLRREKAEEAARELRLAEAFNVGNVYGLDTGTAALRRKMGLPLDAREPAAFPADMYLASEPLSTEDERMIALLLALSKYAVREEDRGKVLNNLAVHFADSDKPETALEYFRRALAALKDAGPERFELARKVLSHMDAACRRAGLEEAKEYRRMQDLVRP